MSYSRLSFSTSNKDDTKVNEEELVVQSDNVESNEQQDGDISYTFDTNQIKGNRNNTLGLLLMMFTCNVCQQKAGRTFSKDAYTKGVVLIRCEKCDNLHLIADNLGWFRDEKVNIEQIMKEKGSKVNKYVTNESLEFILDKDDIHKEQKQQVGQGHQHGEGCQEDHDHSNCDHPHHNHNHEHTHEHHDGCCGHDHGDDHSHKK